MALTSQNNKSRAQSGQEGYQGGSFLVVSETQELQTGNHSLHIRIPKEVYVKIQAEAAQNYMSANRVILALVLKEFGTAP